MKKRLVETIRSVVRPENIYGLKGQEVMIKWNDERVAIVETESGSRFSVLMEKLTDNEMNQEPEINLEPKTIFNKPVPGTRKKKQRVPHKTNSLFNE